MRVLIAEDEEISRKVVVDAVKSWGHTVVAAEDGEEAWERFRDTQPHVVITDKAMPRSSGLELTGRIRRVRTRHYVWVVMISASGSVAQTMAEAMEAGVDDFLQKPFVPEHVRARLNVAARVIGLTEQIREISSILPICMHCKAVRSKDQGWGRIEEYFARLNVDLSHGFCPDCYYRHALLPDVLAFRQARRPRGSSEEPVSGDRLQELREFDRRVAPGLTAELVNFAVHGARERIGTDLQKLAEGAPLPPGAENRLLDFASVLEDVGAFRAADSVRSLAEYRTNRSELAVLALADCEKALVSLRKEFGE